MESSVGVWKIPLLSLLVIVIIGVVYLMLANTPRVMPSSRLTPPSLAPVEKTVKVQVSPNPLVVKEGAKGELSIVINSEVDKVSGIEVKLSYDPKVVKLTKVSAGGLFSNPTELEKEVDSKRGTAIYVLGTLSPKLGKGEIVKIEFEGIKKGTASINFDGSKVVAIGKKGNVGSGLKTAEVVVE